MVWCEGGYGRLVKEPAVPCFKQLNGCKIRKFSSVSPQTPDREKGDMPALCRISLFWCEEGQ